MRRAALVFWGSAALASVAFAALVPVLFPYGALGLDRATEEHRVWLLTVFCAGVLGVLFGGAAWLGTPRAFLVRDAREAGGVPAAAERERRARAAGEGRGYERNFAAWTTVTGALLIGIYFILWRALA